MQSLKQPAMLVSIATATSLVGVTIYFHRRLSAQQDEIKDILGNWEIYCRKVKSLEAYGENITELTELVESIEAQTLKATKTMESFREALEAQAASIEEIHFALENIAKGLEEVGVTVELRPPSPPRRNVRAKTSGNRVTFDSKPKQVKKAPPLPEPEEEEEEEEQEEEEEEPPRPVRRPQNTRTKVERKKEEVTETEDTSKKDDLTAQLEAVRQQRAQRRRNQQNA